MDILLVVSGVAGMLIAVVHGVLGHRMVLAPVSGLSTSARKINTAVFQLSTLYWFAGGLAVCLAPWLFDGNAREAVVIAVVLMYLAGAAGNAWATRGRHFGWPLLTVTAILALMGL